MTRLRRDLALKFLPASLLRRVMVSRHLSDSARQEMGISLLSIAGQHRYKGRLIVAGRASSLGLDLAVQSWRRGPVSEQILSTLRAVLQSDDNSRLPEHSEELCIALTRSHASDQAARTWIGLSGLLSTQGLFRAAQLARALGRSALADHPELLSPLRRRALAMELVVTRDSPTKLASLGFSEEAVVLPTQSSPLRGYEERQRQFSESIAERRIVLLGPGARDSDAAMTQECDAVCLLKDLPTHVTDRPAVVFASSSFERSIARDRELRDLFRQAFPDQLMAVITKGVPIVREPWVVPSDFVPVLLAGSPQLGQRAVCHLLGARAKAVHLSGFDLYSRATLQSEDSLSAKQQRKQRRVKNPPWYCWNMAHHDIFSQFNLFRFIGSRFPVTTDEPLSKLLRGDESMFAAALEHRHSQWFGDAGRSPEHLRN